MFIIILCKCTHTVPEPGSHVSQPVGLRLRCRYGNKSTSMLSDNIFNSVWPLPLLFQQQQRLCQDLFYSNPTVDPLQQKCWWKGRWRQKMWGGNDDISRECQKEKQIDGFSKSNTIAWVNLRMKGNRSGQRGKEEEMASDKETESNNNGRGRKREREREKCCHSSVNFSPSNPIRSTAHPAMAYGTAEQGGIKRSETNTRRKVGKVWKRAMKNV